jgi:site-specific DNA-cytosine methylase
MTLINSEHCIVREIRHFSLFCGLGGGSLGFNKARPEAMRIGNMTAKFRCVGAIDVDPGSVKDFGRLTGVPATLLDLFDVKQYFDFHGHMPPTGWREATPDDVRAAAGYEVPHAVVLSPPCKGFSGLLSETKSKTTKYQALNRLTLRGIWLCLEAWNGDQLPELFILENVPRVMTRGRHLLDQIGGLLKAYGYAVSETTHDCGEIGGLAQSRKRFLMVARHVGKVPPFLYEPPKRPLRGVGEILERMPLPGADAGGPMHRVPALQWQTWVRLAMVEAGSDWRSLNRLRVTDGVLADYLIVPEMRRGVLGVKAWDEPTGTIGGRSGVTNNANSVADPRFEQSARWHHGQQYGVRRWDQTSATVSGQSAPGGGSYSVADPRGGIAESKRNNCFRVVSWSKPSAAVTAGTGPSAGGLAVGDPRVEAGAIHVPDPRTPTLGKDSNYLTGGHYGVLPWSEPSGAVSAAACHDNGRWCVADPRIPAGDDRLVAVIKSLDETWHRPFTTLELAALQNLVEPSEYLELDGLSDQAWRERIGNAIPPGAAQAIAETMGRTLLLAWSGETFMLSSMPIWVQPVAVALAVNSSSFVGEAAQFTL